MNTQTTASTSETAIAYKEVPENQRSAFAPWMFGTLHIHGENAVYRWMGINCREYDGACWDFYRTDNNTGFLAPSLDRSFRMTTKNGFDGIVSAEAAGIIATLYALNTLIWELYLRNPRHPARELLQQKYDGLRDFAGLHAEAAEIYRAID